MKRYLLYNKIRPIIMALNIILFSCEYEPNGLYEVEVSPITEAPSLSVEFNYDTDTLFVPISNMVRLEYSINDPLVRYAYFEINQHQIVAISSNNGSFMIQFNTYDYQIDVPYILSAEFFRSSGSGSLADRYLQEGFLYSKEFVVVIKSAESMIPTIELTPDNGSLKLEWTKYAGLGFIKYHIFNGDYKIGTFTEQNKTSCYDPSFIGYGGFYIVTETEYGTYKSPINYFHDIQLSAEGIKLSDNKVLISWIKNKYYNNLMGYRIYRYIKETGEFNEVLMINNPMDSSYTVTMDLFALNIRYYVKPVAKINDELIEDSNDLQNYSGGTEYFTVGDIIPLNCWYVFEKSPNNNCFYISSRQHTNIFKYNTYSQIITDSIVDTYTHLSLSPNGSKLLIIKNGQMEMVNPETMATNDVIPSTSLPDGVLPWQFYISNTDTGVFFNEYGDYYFYDFMNKSVVAKFRNIGSSSFGHRMRLSPFGNFFCAKHYNPDVATELYKLEDGEVSLVWIKAIDFFEFDPDNNNIIYFENNKLFTVSLVDMSVIKELNISDDYIYDIDWNRREFLCLNNNHNLLTIRDLDSGNIKSGIETRDFSGFWEYEKLYLNNKTIFLRDLKLQLEYL